MGAQPSDSNLKNIIHSTNDRRIDIYETVFVGGMKSPAVSNKMDDSEPVIEHDDCFGDPTKLHQPEVNKTSTSSSRSNATGFDLLSVH